MDVKHQEETELGAEKYLKKINQLHQTHREYLWKKHANGHLTEEPKKPIWGKVSNPAKDIAIGKSWFMKKCLPLKVEIINTEANQLCMPTILKEARVVR